MSEARECPFCGQPPKIREEKRDRVQWWWVECCKQRSDDCPAICWAGAATKAEVLKRWNTRAGRAPLSPEIREALESVLRRASKGISCAHTFGEPCDICITRSFLSVSTHEKEA